ncbi:liver specific protein 1, putative [Plasmodium knowlesi strain H]|uniref:Liver specific protein 1, putative n=3 Tax=Plasmodium knowlesi TaxID=5850 RepID=A0A1A7VKW0_PLAKH|nr:liver specific protein 1, putative [Plasmodium knowlesi strain H]OTN67830.1 putative Liver specific protein 1 [Plasmodium knowlesi]CAA9990424.1 liver specific protein 1, putative [Plasmodium knowlesi strain H]SBO19630.1 liver specific protein 1, putative [Plasmodium knowlesi strain H]SBO22571.1 liver specific protein 1, putative [Plasmodium knowlesi strain H]VVS79898.1 liver specific protein 1, putative [Plasmodium knowlesi strain H]
MRVAHLFSLSLLFLAAHDVLCSKKKGKILGSFSKNSNIVEYLSFLAEDEYKTLLQEVDNELVNKIKNKEIVTKENITATLQLLDKKYKEIDDGAKKRAIANVIIDIREALQKNLPHAENNNEDVENKKELNKSNFLLKLENTYIKRDLANFKKITEDISIRKSYLDKKFKMCGISSEQFLYGAPGKINLSDSSIMEIDYPLFINIVNNNTCQDDLSSSSTSFQSIQLNKFLDLYKPVLDFNMDLLETALKHEMKAYEDSKNEIFFLIRDHYKNYGEVKKFLLNIPMSKLPDSKPNDEMKKEITEYNRIFTYSGGVSESNRKPGDGHILGRHAKEPVYIQPKRYKRIIKIPVKRKKSFINDKTQINVKSPVNVGQLFLRKKENFEQAKKNIYEYHIFLNKSKEKEDEIEAGAVADAIANFDAENLPIEHVTVSSPHTTDSNILKRITIRKFFHKDSTGEEVGGDQPLSLEHEGKGTLPCPENSQYISDGCFYVIPLIHFNYPSGSMYCTPCSNYDKSTYEKCDFRGNFINLNYGKNCLVCIPPSALNNCICNVNSMNGSAPEILMKHPEAILHHPPDQNCMYKNLCTSCAQPSRKLFSSLQKSYICPYCKLRKSVKGEDCTDGYRTKVAPCTSQKGMFYGQAVTNFTILDDDEDEDSIRNVISSGKKAHDKKKTYTDEKAYGEKRRNQPQYPIKDDPSNQGYFKKMYNIDVTANEYDELRQRSPNRVVPLSSDFFDKGNLKGRDGAYDDEDDDEEEEEDDVEEDEVIEGKKGKEKGGENDGVNGPEVDGEDDEDDEGEDEDGVKGKEKSSSKERDNQRYDKKYQQKDDESGKGEVKGKDNFDVTGEDIVMDEEDGGIPYDTNIYDFGEFLKNDNHMNYFKDLYYSTVHNKDSNENKKEEKSFLLNLRFLYKTTFFSRKRTIVSAFLKTPNLDVEYNKGKILFLFKNLFSKIFKDVDYKIKESLVQMIPVVESDEEEDAELTGFDMDFGKVKEHYAGSINMFRHSVFDIHHMAIYFIGPDEKYILLEDIIREIHEEREEEFFDGVVRHYEEGDTHVVEEVSNEAVPNEAVPNEAVSNQAISNQAMDRTDQAKQAKEAEQVGTDMEEGTQGAKENQKGSLQKGEVNQEKREPEEERGETDQGKRTADEEKEKANQEEGEEKQEKGKTKQEKHKSEKAKKKADKLKLKKGKLNQEEDKLNTKVGDTKPISGGEMQSEETKAADKASNKATEKSVDQPEDVALSGKEAQREKGQQEHNADFLKILSNYGNLLSKEDMNVIKDNLNNLVVEKRMINGGEIIEIIIKKKESKQEKEEVDDSNDKYESISIDGDEGVDTINETVKKYMEKYFSVHNIPIYYIENGKISKNTIHVTSDVNCNLDMLKMSILGISNITDKSIDQFNFFLVPKEVEFYNPSKFQEIPHSIWNVQDLYNYSKSIGRKIVIASVDENDLDSIRPRSFDYLYESNRDSEELSAMEGEFVQALAESEPGDDTASVESGIILKKANKRIVPDENPPTRSYEENEIEYINKEITILEDEELYRKGSYYSFFEIYLDNPNRKVNVYNAPIQKTYNLNLFAVDLMNRIVHVPSTFINTNSYKKGMSILDIYTCLEYFSFNRNTNVISSIIYDKSVTLYEILKYLNEKDEHLLIRNKRTEECEDVDNLENIKIPQSINLKDSKIIHLEIPIFYLDEQSYFYHDRLTLMNVPENMTALDLSNFVKNIINSKLNSFNINALKDLQIFTIREKKWENVDDTLTASELKMNHNDLYTLFIRKKFLTKNNFQTLANLEIDLADSNIYIKKLDIYINYNFGPYSLHHLSLYIDSNNLKNLILRNTNAFISDSFLREFFFVYSSRHPVGGGYKVEHPEQDSEHSVDYQLSNGQLSNGQLSNGQLSNGQLSNGQLSNGQLSNGQLRNGQLRNGHLSSGDNSEVYIEDEEESKGGDKKIAFLFLLNMLSRFYKIKFSASRMMETVLAQLLELSGKDSNENPLLEMKKSSKKTKNLELYLGNNSKKISVKNVPLSLLVWKFINILMRGSFNIPVEEKEKLYNLFVIVPKDKHKVKNHDYYFSSIPGYTIEEMLKIIEKDNLLLMKAYPDHLNHIRNSEHFDSYMIFPLDSLPSVIDFNNPVGSLSFYVNYKNEKKITHIINVPEKITTDKLLKSILLDMYSKWQKLPKDEKIKFSLYVDNDEITDVKKYINSGEGAQLRTFISLGKKKNDQKKSKKNYVDLDKITELDAINVSDAELKTAQLYDKTLREILVKDYIDYNNISVSGYTLSIYVYDGVAYKPVVIFNVPLSATNKDIINFLLIKANHINTKKLVDEFLLLNEESFILMKTKTIVEQNVVFIGELTELINLDRTKLYVVHKPLFNALDDIFRNVAGRKYDFKSEKNTVINVNDEKGTLTFNLMFNKNKKRVLTVLNIPHNMYITEFLRFAIGYQRKWIYKYVNFYLIKGSEKYVLNDYKDVIRYGRTISEIFKMCKSGDPCTLHIEIMSHDSANKVKKENLDGRDRGSIVIKELRKKLVADEIDNKKLDLSVVCFEYNAGLYEKHLFGASRICNIPKNYTVADVLNYVKTKLKEETKMKNVDDLQLKIIFNESYVTIPEELNMEYVINYYFTDAPSIVSISQKDELLNLIHLTLHDTVIDIKNDTFVKKSIPLYIKKGRHLQNVKLKNIPFGITEDNLITYLLNYLTKNAEVIKFMKDNTSVCIYPNCDPVYVHLEKKQLSFVASLSYHIAMKKIIYLSTVESHENFYSQLSHFEFNFEKSQYYSETKASRSSSSKTTKKNNNTDVLMNIDVNIHFPNLQKTVRVKNFNMDMEIEDLLSKTFQSITTKSYKWNDLFTFVGSTSMYNNDSQGNDKEEGSYLEDKKAKTFKDQLYEEGNITFIYKSEHNAIHDYLISRVIYMPAMINYQTTYISLKTSISGFHNNTTTLYGFPNYLTPAFTLTIVQYNFFKLIGKTYLDLFGCSYDDRFNDEDLYDHTQIALKKSDPILKDSLKGESKKEKMRLIMKVRRKDAKYIDTIKDLTTSELNIECQKLENEEDMEECTDMISALNTSSIFWRSSVLGFMANSVVIRDNYNNTLMLPYIDFRVNEKILLQNILCHINLSPYLYKLFELTHIDKKGISFKKGLKNSVPHIQCLLSYGFSIYFDLNHNNKLDNYYGFQIGGVESFDITQVHSFQNLHEQHFVEFFLHNSDGTHVFVKNVYRDMTVSTLINELSKARHHIHGVKYNEVSSFYKLIYILDQKDIFEIKPDASIEDVYDIVLRYSKSNFVLKVVKKDGQGYRDGNDDRSSSLAERDMPEMHLSSYPSIVDLSQNNFQVVMYLLLKPLENNNLFRDQTAPKIIINNVPSSTFIVSIKEYLLILFKDYFERLELSQNLHSRFYEFEINLVIVSMNPITRKIQELNANILSNLTVSNFYSIYYNAGLVLQLDKVKIFKPNFYNDFIKHFSSVVIDFSYESLQKS